MKNGGRGDERISDFSHIFNKLANTILGIHDETKAIFSSFIGTTDHYRESFFDVTPVCIFTTIVQIFLRSQHIPTVIFYNFDN